jgi:hypothetical protein
MIHTDEETLELLHLIICCASCRTCNIRAIFGFQNIMQYRLNMDLKPHPHLTLLFQAESLHVATRCDSLYDSAGSLFLKAPPSVFTSDHIGTGFDASAKYVYYKSLVFQVCCCPFLPTV